MGPVESLHRITVEYFGFFVCFLLPSLLPFFFRKVLGQLSGSGDV